MTCSDACRQSHNRLVRELADEYRMEITENGRRIFVPHIADEYVAKYLMPPLTEELQERYRRAIKQYKARYGEQEADEFARALLTGRSVVFHDDGETILYLYSDEDDEVPQLTPVRA